MGGFIAELVVVVAAGALAVGAFLGATLVDRCGSFVAQRGPAAGTA